MTLEMLRCVRYVFENVLKPICGERTIGRSILWRESFSVKVIYFSLCREGDEMWIH
jgi:hypothetical protein